MKAIHWAGSALALLSCSALAQTPAPKADLAAGKARVEAVCAACHGANGVSVADNIPNLAGQRVPYLEAQLRALKSGARKNAVMGAIAAQLSSEDIVNVAAYFGSLQPALRGGEVGAAAGAGEDERRLSRELQGHLHDVPDGQPLGHQPGALPLGQPGRRCRRRARAGRCRPAPCSCSSSTRPSSTPTRKPVTGSDGFYVATASSPSR